jgi:prepilin-type N-terminal cleavage/methylation domain-containing protein
MKLLCSPGPVTGPPARAAFTLPEMLVGVAMGSLVLAAVASLSIYSARSFVAMSNYVDLDKFSRNALDQMSRDIRQTAGLKTYSPSALTFTNMDNSELTIAWNPTTRRVTSTQAGVTKTLLTQCDYLRFNMSQRNASNGVFGFYPTSNPGLCKLVDVSWRCSREMLGRKYHTESVQTAKIVIRN